MIQVKPPKYKEGDIVYSQPISWYNNRKDRKKGVVDCVGATFMKEQAKYCGERMIIKEVVKTGFGSYYKMIGNKYCWTDEMIV